MSVNKDSGPYRSMTGLERALSGKGGPPAARYMSLRDWFAGQALAGLLGCLTRPTINGEPVGDPDSYAKVAYANADAMLEARNV